MEFDRFTLILLATLFFISLFAIIDLNKRKRRRFIDSYIFPNKLNEKLKVAYPHLTSENIELVLKGLREYFHICNIAGKTMIAMPSQVVDVAWHELILFTKEYNHFCKKSFGRFLHHTPAEAMEGQKIAQESIKKIWIISCERENITADMPEKLPILFALDCLLDIPDGFKYTLDCDDENKEYFCVDYIGGGKVGTTSSSGGCGGGCSSGCGGGS